MTTFLLCLGIYLVGYYLGRHETKERVRRVLSEGCSTETVEFFCGVI